MAKDEPGAGGALAPERLLRPELLAMQAYQVAEPGQVVKLDAMENPFPWPGPLSEAWLESLRDLPLNRYPDAAATGLTARLRKDFRLPESASLVLGNGSDELIQMLIMAVARHGATVLSVEPTFVMYRLLSAALGLNYCPVPLRSRDFSLDTVALLDAVRRHDPALIFLAYPNNPTGNLFDPDAVRQVLETARGLVVLDEAYYSFARRSFVDLLAEFPNLVVLRTVSKLGLAGLRLGFLVAAPTWTRQLHKLRLPYNINSLTQASAVFALRHLHVLDQQADLIVEERGRLQRALTDLPELTVYPSEANFVLFRVSEGRAGAIFQGLLEAGILIKNLSPAGGLLTDCLRVTVGAPRENRQFLQALRELIRQPSNAVARQRPGSG